jgi:hypothetical protein
VLKKKFENLRKKNGGKFRMMQRWWSKEYKALKVLVDEHPEYYLDELVEHLFLKTGSLFHPSAVRKVLKRRLNYLIYCMVGYKQVGTTAWWLFQRQTLFNSCDGQRHHASGSTGSRGYWSQRGNLFAFTAIQSRFQSYWNDVFSIQGISEEAPIAH